MGTHGGGFLLLESLYLSCTVVQPLVPSVLGGALGQSGRGLEG